MKGVITRTAPVQKTYPNGVFTESIGDYMMAWEGGDFDLSHAKDCPYLLDVWDKQDLLAYCIGRPTNIKTDLLSYEDYQEALATIQLSFDPKPIRARDVFNKLCWNYTVVIVGSDNFFEKSSIGYDAAFNNIRHRLLCGEPVKINGKKMQLETPLRGDCVSFVKI